MRLINSGLRAMARDVIPAVTYCKARMKIPRYSVVLNNPNMSNGFHSDFKGKRWRETNVENKSMIPPAIRNRMVNKNNGSAERSPNLPAVEADAHKKANSTPMRTFFKREGKSVRFG